MSIAIPPPLERICGYCKFYHAENGECRRHAPSQPLTIKGHKFPTMPYNETCGDYEHGPRWFEEMAKRPHVIWGSKGELSAVVIYDQKPKDA